MTICPGELKFAGCTMPAADASRQSSSVASGLQPDDGGHGPLLLLAGLLHQFAAQPDEPEAVFEAERACDHERGVLAERVSRRPWPGCTMGEQPGDDHAVQEDRGLGVPRLAEFFLRAFKADRC